MARLARLERLADLGVGGEQVDALADAFADALGLVHQGVAGGLQLGAERLIALALDPGAVGLDERREGADQAGAVEAGELAHLGDLDADLVARVLVADAADLVVGDLGGPQLADPVVAVRARDVDAGVVADGPLEVVAEGEGEDPLVVVGGVLAAAVGAGQEAAG
jgi:hypothetical protein